MRFLFAGVILLDIFVIGGGFYQGWFPLSSLSAAAGHDEDDFYLAIDTGKIKEDTEMNKNMTDDLADKDSDAVTEPIRVDVAETILF